MISRKMGGTLHIKRCTCEQRKIKVKKSQEKSQALIVTGKEIKVLNFRNSNVRNIFIEETKCSEHTISRKSRQFVLPPFSSQVSKLPFSFRRRFKICFVTINGR